MLNYRYARPKFHREDGRVVYYSEFHRSIDCRKHGWKIAHCGDRGAEPFVSLKQRIQRRNAYPNPTHNFMFEYAKRFYGEHQFAYMPLVGLSPSYGNRDCYMGKKLGCHA